MNNRRLEPRDLMTLETYARERATFRRRVIEHKRLRTIQCGPNVTWCFEDRLTVQYQVQEMLRIERIFEAEGIADELGAYNPLIPDGTNWKVTLLIEFPDEAERRAALAVFKGIEDRCWVQIGDYVRVFAIADEDLDRENDEKTSSVHFLRFELDAEMVAAARTGGRIQIGIDHDRYRHAVELAPQSRDSLAADLG